MANRWEKVEAVTDFIFLGSKITAGSDCSHEIQRCLLLGRRAMTDLDSILKSKNIALLTKVHILKAMFFPVVMYRCESHKEGWEPKNWSFKLWCWRRLESPLDSRDINQSVLKEINPEYSLEGLMLSWSSNTLATWCQGPTHWKRPWCWERLRTGGERGNKGWDGWMDHWFNGHESSKPWGTVKDWGAWCAAVRGVTKSWARLSDSTTTTANRILESSVILKSGNRGLKLYYSFFITK